MNSLLRTGEVAQKFGLSTQTLYFYERIGLIPPPQRSPSGYRLFGDRDVARLGFILRVKALGLSLDEIREILALYDGKSLTCQVIQDRLQQKVQELDQKIQQLQGLRNELAPLVEQCQTYLSQSSPSGECSALQDITGVVNGNGSPQDASMK
ncbi:MAG: heavy metal-responsive transcriptional regulator [Cyanobacteria bacterium P01_D01_bin.73]